MEARWMVQGILSFQLLFLFQSIGLAQTPDCELKKQKDGIQVYTCKSDTSKFRSLRAEFVIERTTIKDLEAFLFDVPNYVNWQYNAAESKLLEQLDSHTLIYRLVIDAPWPVDNRELIVRFAVQKGIEKVTFTMNTVPSAYPLGEDVIRVPFSQARWEVTPIHTDLHVKYFMNINPGGYVPPMLVNIAMAEGPYQSFRNLKRLIRK